MSIREFNNKKGKTYEVRFQYKDKYGVRRNYSKRGFTKLSEAKKHEKYMRIKVQEEDIKIKKKTVDEVFEEWHNSNNLAITSNQVYAMYYNKHIKPYIGKIKIDAVDYDLLKNITEATTCEQVPNILKKIFNHAYNNNYISRIPFADLKIKKTSKRKKNKIITDDMFNDLMEYTRSQRNGDIYMLAFNIAWYTGMRLGEVLSLENNDINFNDNTITINKTLYYNYADKMLEIKKPKTETSEAAIPLPLPLKKILDEHFKTNTCDIIINSRGNYIRPSRIVSFLIKYSKKHDHINFHMFRHTYTTRLFEAGVDPKTAQILLRHKDFNTTMTIYTHLKEESLNDIVNDVFN